MVRKSRSLGKIDKNFIDLIKSDSFGGILLIFFTIISLVWANSSLKDLYLHILHTPIGIQIGNSKFELSLLHWINEVLMAVFFYLVGLEIKREIIAGELSSPKKAALPALGALGGMILPAIIYISVIKIFGVDAAKSGWGIPMATDIAFSLGILSLLGKRVPLSLKIFLAALAIVDDLGAILVIAFFYTSELNLTWLLIGLGIVLTLFILNRLKFRFIPVYHLSGLVIWYCLYKSGIHATISGVLLALTIPISRKLDLEGFKTSIQKIKELEMHDSRHTLTEGQMHQIKHLKKQVYKIQSPVQRMEHSLHSTVAYVIMPLFALANAGVTFIGTGEKTFSFVSVAIIMGLFFGKTFGITAFAWLGCKIGLSELSRGVKWNQLFGVAILGGLGFTMSLFIAHLAFTDHSILGQAKVGILLGSLLSGIIGFVYLRWLFPSFSTKKKRITSKKKKSSEKKQE